LLIADHAFLSPFALVQTITKQKTINAEWFVSN
jgi:hypothetical protein